VKEIILTPEAGELKIDVRGDLAGILAISLKTKTPATWTGVSQVGMVAGIGFEPIIFRFLADERPLCATGGHSIPVHSAKPPVTWHASGLRATNSHSRF
jgi:hypothetical protein